MKNILKFIAIISLPFILFLAVYLWKLPQWEETEKRKHKELLDDTAKVNEAHRTYERIHHELLMQDSDYVRLYRENEALKKELKQLRDSNRNFVK